MDWKDLLSQKVAAGELPYEESSEQDKADTPNEKKAHTLSVLLDKKGRKGKTATLIVGFTCDDAELKEIAAKLKSKLATGGSSRDGEILIQGDRLNDIKPILREMGYKVK